MTAIVSGTASTNAAGAPDAACTGAATSWRIDEALVQRHAALRAVPAAAAAPAGLRVVTYNIHSGLGQTHALRRSREHVEANLRAIATDIAAASPIDVVALNEVDFDSRRSAGIDEAAFVAGELMRLTGDRYQIVRGETWRRDFPGMRVRFGNALLSRLPIVDAASCLLRDDGAGDDSCAGARPAADLPSLKVSGLRGWFTEQRGIIKASVDTGSGIVDVLVTHLDPFAAATRETQALHILRRFIDPERTTVLLGDLNAVSTELTTTRRFFGGDRTLDVLTSETLSDVRIAYAAERGLDSLNHWPTYPAAAPIWPLDAVLASGNLSAREIRVLGTTASDHRGLLAHLQPPSIDDAAMHHARLDLLRRAQLDRIVRCDIAGDVREGHPRRWLVASTGFRMLVEAVSDAAAAKAATPVAASGAAF